MKYEVNFFGWCYDEVKNHDKFWGYITFEGDDGHNTMYNFWCRRNKKMTFKQHDGYWNGERTLQRLVIEKQQKGYKELTKDQVLTQFPEFFNNMENQLALDKLFDKIR